ncbi:MAG: endolytic transglycosylase MltG [Candidatus Dadabacteria bacterium]|nr:MAG: endolytic transglycosylase MltG [Candidatus Dadabacteria bacterium]
MTSFIRLVIIIALPVLAFTGTYFYLQSEFNEPASKTDRSDILVEIKNGISFKEICKILEDKGVIRNRRFLYLMARLRGSDTRIQAGEYVLQKTMTPKQILAKLMSGDVYKRKVTVKEGMSIWEIGKIVEAAGLMKEAEFNKYLNDPALLAKAGIAAGSFEGYLYPETYYFSRPITAEQIIWTMLEEGEKHWPPEYTEQADKLGFSRHEILTLASIIEKESGNKDEQPLISSVFHNRLAKGIKLQADPTVAYGIPNFKPPLTKKDLETYTPYNTYINPGLPPGPICNPGESAIHAALFPAKTNYLFFVADGEGGHIFSATLKEHNAAVAMYKKLLSQKRKRALEAKQAANQ